MAGNYRRMAIALSAARKENKRWETHWTFLLDWLREYQNDTDVEHARRATALRVAQVMYELRPRGEEE